MSDEKTEIQLIAERLISLMNALGYANEREWGFALGYERPDNIYNATSGKRMPGVKLLIDISKRFEMVNLGWVLTGKGGMYRKEKSGPDEPDHLRTLLDAEIKNIEASLQRLKSDLHVFPDPGINVNAEGYQPAAEGKKAKPGKS